MSWNAPAFFDTAASVVGRASDLQHERPTVSSLHPVATSQAGGQGAERAKRAERSDYPGTSTNKLDREPVRRKKRRERLSKKAAPTSLPPPAR